ncbi:MAG: hypothetical protein IPO81_15455 [Kouleothrix sp.]|nr:hypothetical protein [Kouleothrix sp.]
MKIVARTLAILAAALLVVGATYVYASSSSAAGFEERGGFGRPQIGEQGPPGGFDHGGFDRERGGGPSLFGIGEVIKNFVIIGVIVAVVSLATRLLPRRPAGSGPRQSPPGARPSP